MDEHADVGSTEDVGSDPSRGAQFRTSLARLGLATLAVTVVAAMSGYLFARSSPDRAAATRIAAVVQLEPAAAPDDEVPTRDAAAPTSGDARGAAPCGVEDAALDVDAQVAALAAGRVLVQYRPAEVDGDALAELHDVAGHHRGDVILAPNPDLEQPVVATAWSRRLPLAAVDDGLLDAFATAYAGGGPEPAPCDP
ncbi:MAG: DUF3105 domain-containing protein [Actinobacteria bacterium]|nr:DUF3105 domain-containing protein [Actinomycetota bacterium]